MTNNLSGQRDDGFLRSHWGYRVLWVSAWTVVFVLALLILVLTSYDRITSSHALLSVARLCGGLIGAVSAPAGIIIFFAMFVYLFRWDKESSKLLWVLAFILTGFFASAIYFFVVYRRQMKFLWTTES